MSLIASVSVRFPVCVLACLSGSPIGPLYAASPDTVVVTATRTEQPLGSTLAGVTVLTREDIDRVQARSVEELLRGLAGVALDNVGGFGKATSIFLRGTESDHAVVLIDGVRFGSPTLGIAAFEHIPVEQIERIEIVRGPRSTLYGPDAIGGVIQFITRRAGDRIDVSAQTGYGSHATRRLSAGIDAQSSRLWLSAHVADFVTDGIDACAGLPFPPGGGCFTSEPDRDGYDNRSASLRAGMRLDDRTELEARVLNAAGSTEFDGSFTNHADFRARSGSVHLKHRASAELTFSALVGRSVDDSENFLGDTFRSRFDTRRDSLSLQADLSLGTPGLLTAGFDYLGDKVRSTTAYTVDSRFDRGAYVQYDARWGQQHLTAGLRHDDNEQFGERSTGNLAYGLGLGAGLRLTASGGTAFKAPTLNELYFPGFGNPGLGVERARAVELALDRTRATSGWALRAFGTEIDDLIAFDAGTRRAENIENVRIAGLELEGSWRRGDWLARGSLTLMNPQNRSPGGNEGKDLPRRARESARLEAARKLGPVEVGAVLSGQGRRFDDLANTVRLNRYAILDLTLAWRFSSAFIVRGRLGNVFDTRYETAGLFNQDGRNWWLSLEYTPF